MTGWIRLLCAAVAVLAGAGLLHAAATGVRDDPAAEKRVADVMAMSEKDLLAIVPTNCPDVTCACPKCGTNLGQWTSKKPFEIQCPKCKTVYPNKAYPMDRTQVFLNFIGEKVAVPYHLGPKPKSNPSGRPHPERYFLNAPIDNKRYGWLSGRVIPDLVRAYKATGKQAYARRAALVLDGFARNYKHYLVHRGRGRCYYVSTGGPCMVDGKKKGTVGVDLPYSWIDTRLVKCWISELNLKFVDAYEAIKDSPALDKLSAEMGVDVRRRISRDLLGRMCDFMLLVPWKWQMSNNLPTLGWIARAGRVIGRPEYVHVGHRYLREIITDYGREYGRAGYAYDLHNPEGNQCHYGMRQAFYGTFKFLEGYSDPPGYKGKTDGLHLENVSLEKDFPLLDAAAHTADAYRFPDGSINPIHDTVGHKGQGGDLGPLKESRCRLLPGFGQAVLGDGDGDEQVQVQLHFSTDNANHTHADCMSLVWWAHGREMSGDIGYQRNKLRAWASGTLSHNTVVVDRANQTGGDTSGNLLLFEPNLPGLTAIQVDGRRAYDKIGVKRYRRTIVLNTRNPAAPYFVDVFEVEGGRRHDYAIHGSVLDNTVGASSLPLKAMPAERPLLEGGEKWKEPKGMGPFNLYGLFRNVKAAAATRDFHIDFTCNDAPAVGTRIHMLRDPSVQVFLAETPALRKAGHYKDDRVYDSKMPHLLVRRSRAEGEMKSIFVAVYDVFQGGPKITSVKRLPAGENALALRIASGSTVDTLLVALDGPKAMSAGGVRMNGRLGLVSETGAKADAYLVGGTVLEKGSVKLAATAASYRGSIAAATRARDGDPTNSFVTDAELPVGTALRGSWMIVAHGGGQVTNGYEIDSVERSGGKTRIHLARDHGLRITADGAKEIFSQWRTFKGEETFAIHTRAATVARPVIEPGTGPWDRLKIGRFVPFAGSVEVTLKADGAKEIRYTTDGSEPTASSTRYAGPFVLTRSATVKAIVPNPTGIMPPRVVEQVFQRAREPDRAATAQPGLKVGVISDSKTVKEDVAEAFALPALPAGRLKDPTAAFGGLIRVPRDGIYTFYVRAAGDCLLTVGRLDLIDTKGLGPYREWAARLALEAGLHPIRLRCRYGGGRSRPTLSVKYEGPGVAKQTVPASALFHAAG